MDFTIWVDGEETLRTRNTAEARKAYRKALLREQPVPGVCLHGNARLRELLAEFDRAAETPGVFSVGPHLGVEAMFHR